MVVLQVVFVLTSTVNNFIKLLLHRGFTLVVEGVSVRSTVKVEYSSLIFKYSV